MKFANENIVKALAAVGPLTKEGRLFHRKNLKKSFKSRWFKLKANLLYYYKTNEYGNINDDEPLGVLVLASCSVKMDFLPDAPFVFSVLFKLSNERHYFCGVNTDQCIEWIDALQCACYSTMREQYDSLRKEIALRCENEITNTPKSALFHRRIGKSFNTARPRRYEKRFQSADKLRTPRDRSLDQIRKSVPEGDVKRSGGALEQVRKSYSLANLMINGETGQSYSSLSPNASPNMRPPSTSLADDNKKNNFFNFEFKPFENKKKKRSKVKKQPSEGATYKYYSHNYRNSTYDIACNEKAYLLPASLASGPFLSSSTERIDFNGSKKNKKQQKRKSIDQQQVITNEQFQMLKKSFNKNKYSKNIPNNQTNSELHAHKNNKLTSKSTEKSTDETLGIILEPLSLASNPFLNTYSKSMSQEKHIEKKKSLLRHGYSVVDGKRNTRSKETSSFDKRSGKNEDSDNSDDEDNSCTFIQRPRSCTLAQLEKIPSYLRRRSNHTKHEYSNEGVVEDDDYLDWCKNDILRSSLNFPSVHTFKGCYNVSDVIKNQNVAHDADENLHQTLAVAKTNIGSDEELRNRRVVENIASRSPPEIRQGKKERSRFD